jgi:cytochrome c oxidase assembly protein subunit 15
MSTITTTQTSPPRWLHRLCLLAVCLVWPLIWVGGLVTTYDAGMSVPDWPGTYGYNLFLYPFKTWLFGPFDLLIEHGHRLLGAVVGFVAIGIVAVAFWTESRRWVKVLCVGLLIAVIAQGALGGMRVVLGDRTLAMIHGCFGPAFFALCGVSVVVTSTRWWNQSQIGGSFRPIGKFAIAMGFGLIGLAYTQLVLGAQLRHALPTTRPGIFAMTVMMHVLTAFILWALTAGVWLRLRRCADLTLSRTAVGLVGLVFVQIVLGVGTWAVNYGWPTILEWVPGSTDYLLRAKGFADSIIVTAHVATGSLILAVSAMLTTRLWRVRWLQIAADCRNESIAGVVAPRPAPRSRELVPEHASS